MDDEPRISINDVSAPEGNSGTTPFTFTVSLSAAYNMPVTVNYATANGTAAAGGDYTAASGTLTFEPGQPTSQTVTVLVNGDRLFEPNETFFVNLSTPDGHAEISRGTGFGTIIEDDPRISIARRVQLRRVTPFTFTVSLSAASTEAVTVDFATVDGTALAGVDYVFTAGTLTFDTRRDDPDDHGRRARPDVRRRTSTSPFTSATPRPMRSSATWRRPALVLRLRVLGRRRVVVRPVGLWVLLTGPRRPEQQGAERPEAGYRPKIGRRGTGRQARPPAPAPSPGLRGGGCPVAVRPTHWGLRGTRLLTPGGLLTRGAVSFELRTSGPEGNGRGTARPLRCLYRNGEFLPRDGLGGNARKTGRKRGPSGGHPLGGFC